MPLRPRSAPALLILLAALCGCAPSEVKVFEHTVLGGRPSTIVRPLRFGVLIAEADPAAAAAQRTRLVQALVHARLFTRDAAGRITGDLVAETSIAPDGRAFTFKLRDDAHWHDGRGVTARDVVAAAVAFRERPAPVLAAALSAVRSVTAQGPHTVRWTLERPLPDLPAVLLEMEVRVPGPRSGTGAGPWRLLSSNRAAATLAPHAGWHRGSARTDLLRLVWFSDEAGLQSALEEGRVDLGLLGEASLSGGLGRTVVRDTAGDRLAVLLPAPGHPALSAARARRALGRRLPGTERLARLGVPRRRLLPDLPAVPGAAPRPASELRLADDLLLEVPRGDATLAALARLLLFTWKAHGVPARSAAIGETPSLRLSWLAAGAGLVWRLAPAIRSAGPGRDPGLLERFREALALRNLPDRRRAALQLERAILESALVLPVADVRAALVARPDLDLGGLRPRPGAIAIARQLWRVALPPDPGR